MRLTLLLLLIPIFSSCAMRFHVCVETDYKAMCDECKKKPIISYHPYEERPDKSIPIIEIPFLRDYAA